MDSKNNQKEDVPKKVAQKKRPVTIRAALIGGIFIIIAAIISGLLLWFSNSKTSSSEQTIENKNSPNSVIIQGNENSLNFNVYPTNEKLQRYFLEGNKNDTELNLIINEILKENNNNISKELLYDYSQSILNIYETLYKNAKLILNDSLNSLVNDKKYIVDIGVHTNSLGHNITLAFKLLPIERKAIMEDILYFLLALKDTKVVKGIIICNGGFSDEIVEYANKNDIDLCVLRDTKSKRWDENLEIPVIWIKNTIKIWADLRTSNKVPKNVPPPQNPLELEMSINNNKSFTIIEFFSDSWNKNKIPHMTDSVYTYSFPPSLTKIRIDSSAWFPVDKFDLHYTTRLEYYLKYVKPENYEAIENIITKDAIVKNLEAHIPPFTEELNWIKIGENKREDQSPGEKITFPDGLKIIVTTQFGNISKDKYQIDNFQFYKNR